MKKIVEIFAQYSTEAIKEIQQRCKELEVVLMFYVSIMECKNVINVSTPSVATDPNAMLHATNIFKQT